MCSRWGSCLVITCMENGTQLHAVSNLCKLVQVWGRKHGIPAPLLQQPYLWNWLTLFRHRAVCNFATYCKMVMTQLRGQLCLCDTSVLAHFHVHRPKACTSVVVWNYEGILQLVGVEAVKVKVVVVFVPGLKMQNSIMYSDVAWHMCGKKTLQCVPWRTCGGPVKYTSSSVAWCVCESQKCTAP